MILAVLYNNEKCVELLIEARANLDIIGQDGSSLMLAHYINNRKVVQVLLNGGASLRLKDTASEKSCLNYAAKCHTKCLDLLLEVGCDVQSCNMLINTVVHEILQSCSHADCLGLHACLVSCYESGFNKKHSQLLG